MSATATAPVPPTAVEKPSPDHVASSPEQPMAFSWTPATYNAAAEAGAFDGQRVELIYGKIYAMPPMGDPHRLCILKGLSLFAKMFDTDESHISCQAPFRLEHSEPEPDLAVLAGRPRDGAYAVEDVLLVVEASHDTLRFDRTVKLRLYAESGYAEYWIVNVVDRKLIVHREPRQVGGEWSYASVTTYDSSAEAAPLFAPDKPVKVDDLLP